jgi:dTDP-glucose 4,6-dehydratase
VAKTLLVTGGAGFIGSALVRHLLRATPHRVINVDRLGYASSLEALEGLFDHPRHHFERLDIRERDKLDALFAAHRLDGVFHLAAETHVDRSIDASDAFMQSNVLGTHALLEAARAHWEGLDEAGRAAFRFVHVSTDEVYGSLGPEGTFTEASPYAPRSPYAASKAAADHLARAWHHTYGLPTLVTTCTNNYGPYQFPEKLIPLVILKAIRREAIPVYGQGEHVRDWLYVEDHVRGLLAALERGRAGETYALGGRNERSNLELVRAICRILDEFVPGMCHEALIRFVADRPGHDRRYAIDPSKAERELGWRAEVSLQEGLRKTVQWYLDNRAWWEPIVAERYNLERLGVRP